MTTSELVASINATDQESVEAVRSLVSKHKGTRGDGYLFHE